MKKIEIKKLDAQWSLKVKELAGFKCEYCGALGIQVGGDKCLNSCHIVGRRNRSTRWLILNGMCLCYAHHMAYDHHLPQHEDIRKEVIGEERMQKLVVVARQIARNQEYKTISEEIEQYSK